MVSQQIVDIIIKAQDQASSAAEKVDASLQKIGKSSSVLSKIPGFDTLRTKFSGLANTIGTKFSGAIDGVRGKLQSLSNGAKGLESAMGFLKGAVSMTAGMIGFELVGALTEAGRSAINARSQLDYFANRLNMSATEVGTFKQQISQLQQEFRKVDMTAVGATAEEIALKMDLPKNKIGDLTRMTAVLSSTFVKEGRTQEDAVLAVGDALDGQFKRLQEIGITQDKLKQNGWSGELSDQAGLIDALNKTMKDMGYEQTAKDITTLDEAFTALSVAGGNLLADILIPITPALISVMEAVMNALDAVKPFISTLQSAAGALPQWLQDAGWATLLGIGLYALGTVIMGTVVPALAAAALAALEFAVAMLMNPWTYVLVAIVAIAYAIYELGKAFGWWDDVSGMWNAFLNNILMPIWNFLVSVFTPAWNFLGSVISAIMPFINNLGAAFTAFTTGQMSLPGLIMSIMTNVFNVYKTIFSMVITALVSFGKQMLAKGVSLATSFVNGIIARIRQLPGKVYTGLIAVVGRIRSAIQSWISAGVSKVQSLISQITSPFSGVAGRISGALSGVASAITAPFKAAWDALSPLVDKIKAGMQLIGAAGYDYLEGQNPDGSWGSNAAGYEITTNEYVQTLTGEFTFIHDLRNVPNGVSAEEVASIVEKSTTSDDFIKKLVANSVFQKYDLKIKSNITSKNNRARGV